MYNIKYELFPKLSYEQKQLMTKEELKNYSKGRKQEYLQKRFQILKVNDEYKDKYLSIVKSKQNYYKNNREVIIAQTKNNTKKRREALKELQKMCNEEILNIVKEQEQEQNPQMQPLEVFINDLETKELNIIDVN